MVVRGPVKAANSPIHHAQVLLTMAQNTLQCNCWELLLCFVLLVKLAVPETLYINIYCVDTRQLECNQIQLENIHALHYAFKGHSWPFWRHIKQVSSHVATKLVTHAAEDLPSTSVWNVWKEDNSCCTSFSLTQDFSGVHEGVCSEGWYDTLWH